MIHFVVCKMADLEKVFSDESEVFERAANHLATLVSSLEEEKLLYLYARYKQAKEGPCDVPKPGFFSIQAKKKWAAWKGLGSMSRSQAMREYVDEITAADPNWNSKRDDSRHKVSGLGVSVSKLMFGSEDEACDGKSEIFDWVKDGKKPLIERALESGGNPNQRDAEGMALLHWASDRGYCEIVKLLLNYGANVNLQDNDGQTALHYASSCGHTETIEVLISNGADIKIPDNDNQTAIDVAIDASIASLICR